MHSVSTIQLKYLILTITALIEHFVVIDVSAKIKFHVLQQLAKEAFSRGLIMLEQDVKLSTPHNNILLSFKH